MLTILQKFCLIFMLLAVAECLPPFENGTKVGGKAADKTEVEVESDEDESSESDEDSDEELDSESESESDEDDSESDEDDKLSKKLDVPAIKGKVDKFIAGYKLPNDWKVGSQVAEKDTVKLLTYIVVRLDLTDEEIALIVCAILCALGTCPPSCPAYYEPPWGPLANRHQFDVPDL